MNRDWWDHECSQAVNSVASEYDWLRGLWDLDTDEGYTYASLVQVLADAYPHTWTEEPDPELLNGDPACPADFDYDAHVSCAYVRMGVDHSVVPQTVPPTIRTNWEDQCDNGICR